MNKYITKRVAKKMLIAGSILWVVTTVSALIIQWNIAGLTGTSFETDNSNVNIEDDLRARQTFAKVNLYAQIGAYIILALGVINLILSRYKKVG